MVKCSKCGKVIYNKSNMVNIQGMDGTIYNLCPKCDKLYIQHVKSFFNKKEDHKLEKDLLKSDCKTWAEILEIFRQNVDSVDIRFKEQ